MTDELDYQLTEYLDGYQFGELVERTTEDQLNGLLQLTRPGWEFQNDDDGFYLSNSPKVGIVGCTQIDMTADTGWKELLGFINEVESK